MASRTNMTHNIDPHDTHKNQKWISALSDQHGQKSMLTVTLAKVQAKKSGIKWKRNMVSITTDGIKHFDVQRLQQYSSLKLFQQASLHDPYITNGHKTNNNYSYVHV